MNANKESRFMIRMTQILMLAVGVGGVIAVNIISPMDTWAGVPIALLLVCGAVLSELFLL